MCAEESHPIDFDIRLHLEWNYAVAK